MAELHPGKVVVQVEATVRVVPARRGASFTVPLVVDKPTPHTVLIKSTLQRTEVKIEWPGGRYYLPRSLATIDSMVAMLMAVRAELIEQGVTE